MPVGADLINDKFIANWESRYDNSESDEREYKDLVRRAAADVAEVGTLKRDTFTGIFELEMDRAEGEN